MDLNILEQKLKGEISFKRYTHSVGVKNEAEKLAKAYGADVLKAQIAGLIHDCAKNYSYDIQYKLCEKYNITLDEISKNQPQIIHGFVGAYIAKYEYEIDDSDIFDAIYFHTIGKKDMPLLTKIIFLADYIEVGRKIFGIEKLRKLAYENLDKAIVMAIDFTTSFVLKKGDLLHLNSVEARNSIILNERSRVKWMLKNFLNIF